MKKKICMVASCGGHMDELLCLREIAEENDAYWVTEKNASFPEKNEGKVYYVNQINRNEKKFIRHFINLSVQAIKITAKEKPDVVITTGALIAVPFCLAAKLRRKKIIYIETYARITGKSLTGTILYPFADLFLVQWETLLKYYPKAKYIGGIF